ncbi:ABZJ_00895 family protein [Bosea sp. ASV33]|uniref:ABZJ_00895 family protein n=1 Tax=Bosea sp. ASV33 TaxID=2795106 RepID=UPI0018EAF721|nr:ABZJ_00895 family protein [Bosea sp. ASV33]
MSQPSTMSPISSGALLLRYIAFLIIGVIVLNVAIMALESYFKQSPGSTGALGLILIWSAASWVGQIWFRREQTRPPSGRAWSVALLCALATLVLQALFVLVIAGFMPGGFASIARYRSSDQVLIAGAFLGIFVLEFLLIRAAISWGARAEEKRAQRLAAKGAV